MDLTACHGRRTHACRDGDEERAFTRATGTRSVPESRGLSSGIIPTHFPVVERRARAGMAYVKRNLEKVKVSRSVDEGRG